MSGLVAYDSSSDEDGAENHVSQQQQQQQQVGVVLKLPNEERRTQGALDATVQLVGTDSKEVTANDVGGGALLGPTMPEGSYAALERTSEQDLIRHLTQATHPMSSIPESPPGSPDPIANARIQRFLELKGRGVHFNEDLANKPTFKNPSLLATMMTRAGIEETEQYDTSLPTGLWDPSNLPAWAYKEALLKSQQDLREKDEIYKKTLSAAGKRSIEFTSASNSAVSSRNSTPKQQSKRRRPG